MKGTIAGFIVAALVVLATHATAQVPESPQEFMRGQSASSAKAGRVQRSETPIGVMPFVSVLGGSWLEANLGASRPHGAPGPWCGFAMRLEVMSMGRADPGPAYNAVSSWHNYGSPAPRAAIGSLFISRGHISKVVAGECPAGSVRTISGNAIGARVTYMCEPLSSLVVSRWP
jgi:hypothetical protein